MKSIRPLKIGNGGMSLIEVFVGIIILAITALMVAKATYSISRAEDLTKKKSLANQVCVQLMDEMRYLGNEGKGINTIDDEDDGDRLNPNLFIIDSRGPNSRAHLMLLRQINVFHVPGEDRSRRVRVRVFDKRTNEILAETIGFVRLYADDIPPVQSMDTYMIETGETPFNIGFNSFLNPRLAIRMLRVGPSVGERGRENYGPKIITNKGQLPFNLTYTDEPTNLAYLTSGSNNIDMFNHLERYPLDGGSIGESVRAWPGSVGRPPPQKPTPTLRYLLNEMAAGNPDYRHSLLINQGRILSLPPMRNNSVAAKDPENRRYLRAVIHPENIRYDSGSKVKLRVYTYVTQPDLFPENSTTTVDVHLNGNFSETDIKVWRMIGNSTTRYSWEEAVLNNHYTQVVEGGAVTRLTLLNSPLRHPANVTFEGQGIAPNERLYGMEYIPCLVKDRSEFDEGHEDLADNGTNFVNNTARWVIEIEAGATPDGALTVATHLGEHVTPHLSSNISTTYVWVGTDVPLTERFQLIGDPRHMPYADVKRDEGYNWFFARIDESDGYKNFDRTQDGWTYETVLPNGDPVVQRLNFDFPRYMDIYRTALMNSNSSMLVGFSSVGSIDSTPLSFVTLGSFSLGTSIMGQLALRCPETAWVPNSNELRNIAEWAPPPRSSPGDWHSNLRLVARTDNSWFCIPWLGELYPDDQFQVWRENRGNLPTGPGNFYRAPYSVFFSTLGHNVPLDFSFQIFGAGLTTFMNGGQSDRRWVFNPFRSAQTAWYTDQWKDVEKSMFYFQGTRSDITTSPFSLDVSIRAEDQPPAINDYSRTRVELVREFMKTSGGEPVAGIMRMWDRGDGDQNRSAWVLVNGNNQRSEMHANASYSMNNAMSVWSFLEMGSSFLPIAIQAQPIPLVSWVSPDPHVLLDNPTTLDLAWDMRWRRWDGEPYTSSHPDGFVPNNTNVTYTLLFSGDNRQTWTDIVRARPSGTGVRAWSQPLTSPHTWNVATLPEGRYVLRVEAFRGEADQHFAFHERRIEITRP